LARYAEALQEFESVLRIDPDNEQARQGRARCFEATLREKKRLARIAQERKDYAEAARLLNEYVQSRPGETETLLQLGQLYSWAGEQGRARDYYEKHLARNPDDRIARLELAEIQSWQGDYSAARESFLSVVRADPQNVRALRGIVRCHQWSGALDGVEPYLDRLELVEPGNDLALAVRGELARLLQQRMRARGEQLELAKDYQASIATYREYVAAFGPEPQMELRIARLYAWNRQYEESIEEYQSYLVRYPQSESARLELADVQRWKADYESALQNYSSYLAEHPRHPRGLLGKAEALYATRTDLFEVQKAYQQASHADPGNRLIVDRLREIAAKLRPRAQFQTAGIFDSDGLERVVFEPRVTFLLPAGYRLTSLFHTSYTHQDRFLQGTDPVATALNQHIAEQDGTIWGARTGLRLERQRAWGGWGVEAQIGSFSDDRVSLAVAADLTKRVGEGGLFWTRYAHEEAAFELNTLASLAAGIIGNTWRVEYHQKLPHGFYVSSGYAITHLSDSERFGFRDNWRHAADVRLSYRRFRRFQPGYSYSASSYRNVSPLYFSPELYQAHRFEYLAALGGQERFQFLLNGSLGLGRIDRTNTFEFTLAPQVTLRLPHGVELELLYQFGQSQASSFGRADYTVHGFRFAVRFPIPGVKR